MNIITCEHITNRVCSCDNCNRIMPVILKYKFIDVTETGRKNTFVTLHLCEDCSNALSNLHSNVMEEGKPFIYIKDEIKELEEIQMSCKCASYEEDEGKYTCSVSGNGCVFMFPDSMACAELLGEGPDVGWEEKSDIKDESEEI